MKRIRIMGLCLVAAFAGGAVGAASAQAEAHTDTGNVAIDSSSGIATLSTSSATVQCKTSTDEGEVTSATTDVEVITFEQCETLAKKCNSIGQAAGTIVTNLLATEVGWINKAKGEVGVDFKPQAGTFLMEFECPGSPQVTFKITGSVIGLVGAINVMTVTNTETFTGSGFAQAVQKFEGGPKDTLVSEVSAGGPPTQLETLLQNTATIENDEKETHTPLNDPDFYPDPSEIGTVQSGTPEYGRCRKAGGNSRNYKDPNCTQKEPIGDPDGKWEWFPVPS
jgi:hypothetical protein